MDDLISRAVKMVHNRIKPERRDFCTGDVHRAIHSIAHLIEDEARAGGVSLRFAAIKLVEGDEVTADQISGDRQTDAGSYTAKVGGLAGKDSGNYVLEESVYSWSIAPAEGAPEIQFPSVEGPVTYAPGQTLEQWLDDVRAAIALGPEHVSAYGLTLEPGTPLAESCGDADLPSEDVQCAMYLEGIRLFEEAGLHHYEVSNFARDGFRCRHNLGYWEGRDYLGVGPAATSTIGGERWTNPEGEGWLEQVREGRRCPEREPLDRATRALELMMLRLRTVDGLPLDAYESLAGRSFLGDHGPFAHRLCAEGLARMENGVFRLTDEGMLVSNSILGELFEEEPESAE